MHGKPVKKADSTPSTDAHIQQATDRRGLVRPENRMTGPEYVARNRPEDTSAKSERAPSPPRLLGSVSAKARRRRGRSDCRKAVCKGI